MIISRFFFYNLMSWFHLIFGAVLFIVFLVTGQYMRADFPDKVAIPPELRLLMRSRHIYILFSALIHISIGVYMQKPPQAWRRLVQHVGSTLLIFSSVLLVLAFVNETYILRHFSDLSRNGIYASLSGVLLHLIGGIKWKGGKDKREKAL
ncbi:MAG: hypothetical protein ACT4O9_13565 [Blastocatellia bacterium]